MKGKNEGIILRGNKIWKGRKGWPKGNMNERKGRPIKKIKKGSKKIKKGSKKRKIENWKS